MFLNQMKAKQCPARTRMCSKLVNVARLYGFCCQMVQRAPRRIWKKILTILLTIMANTFSTTIAQTMNTTAQKPNWTPNKACVHIKFHRVGSGFFLIKQFEIKNGRKMVRRQCKPFIVSPFIAETDERNQDCRCQVKREQPFRSTTNDVS